MSGRIDGALRQERPLEVKQVKTLDLSEREITYLLLSLKRYEAQLLQSSDEDLEDTATDVSFIQSLQEKLTQVLEGG